MQEVIPDPVRDLALLPPSHHASLEREWLQNTLAWLKSVPPGKRTERLRRLVVGICEEPGSRERLQAVWEKAFAPRLFCEVGLPEGTSLLQELVARSKRRLLPQVEDELDLYAALQMVDLDDDDAEWIAGLRDEDIEPWRELLARSAGDFAVAIRLLSMRAASTGLSRRVMRMMPHRYETESPFYDLVDAAGCFAQTPTLPEARKRLQDIVLQCRLAASLSHVQMEDHGVSTDLVFRLDLVIAQLERISLLLRVMSGEEDSRRFASMLLLAFAEERGAHSLLRNSVNRLARHIVIHTGKSGEHYIATCKSEWASMGYGAIGAGVLSAFTALFKYSLAAMALAPLWTGIAHSLNYTASFVLMQFLGWRLASKMPSMTAAALCDAMQNEDGMKSEVRLVAAITRSQAVVTVGNLMGAIPTAILVDLVIQWVSGHPFLNHAQALHGVESMHLLRSMTVPFAALTGCFLWLSSLFAGWTANWMVLNRFPAAIAQSRRIRGYIGDERAARLAEIVNHHLSGVAGYVCLGLLLGLLPFISVFAGFPVEVRHITLASASLAYDVSALARSGDLPWGDLGWAFLGLIATGLLNFTVSFALGFWLALRARNLDTNGRKKLISALWDKFRRQPAAFFWRHGLEEEIEIG